MKIVFLDEYSVCGRSMEALSRFGEYKGYDMTAPDEVAERCADADIVITNKVVIDAATMARLPHLKLICVAATGMNNVDLAAAADRGIEVRNAVGYSTYAVAETTLWPCCAKRYIMTDISSRGVMQRRTVSSTSTVRRHSCAAAAGVSSVWVI